MTGLGDLPGGIFRSEAMGVSGDGSVVVGESSSTSGGEAYRWEAGTMIGLGDLPGGIFDSFARGVSGDGSVVVGGGHSASGGEAFRWEAGQMTGLGDLAGGNFYSYAQDVSVDGSVVVGNSYSASGIEAFRWEDDVMTGLGDLTGGEFGSNAFGVSGDGSVVVGYSASALLGQEAFIWDADNGMRSLKDVLINDFGLDMTDWTLGRAHSISNNGLVIVGSGINPYGNTEAWIATVPEPTTLLLLGLGAVILRKKRVRR